MGTTLRGRIVATAMNGGRVVKADVRFPTSSSTKSANAHHRLDLVHGWPKCARTMGYCHDGRHVLMSLRKKEMI